MKARKESSNKECLSNLLDCRIGMAVPVISHDAMVTRRSSYCEMRSVLALIIVTVLYAGRWAGQLRMNLA